MQGNFYMLPHGLSTGNHAPCKKMFRVSHRARLARDGGSDQFELLGTSCPQTRPNPTLGPALSRPDVAGCSRLQTGASSWTSLSAPYAAHLPAGTGIFPGVGQILPQHFLVVAILALSVVGSYSIGSSLMDVLSMAACGLLGYVLVRFRYGVAPMALGLILGTTMEEGFKLSLHLGSAEGNIMLFFFSRPQSLALICLTLLSLGYSIWKECRAGKAGQK